MSKLVQYTSNVPRYKKIKARNICSSSAHGIWNDCVRFLGDQISYTRRFVFFFLPFHFPLPLHLLLLSLPPPSLLHSSFKYKTIKGFKNMFCFTDLSEVVPLQLLGYFKQQDEKSWDVKLKEAIMIIRWSQ